ncbi:MAG: glycosyltransferase family 39 protein [Ardenticatenales bacterium]
MSLFRRSVRARLWLAVATLVATGLRACDLAGQSLWSDEDITLDRARAALGAMLAGLPGEHAPLYFALMRAWTRLAGDGDFALRFPSLLAGVVTVPLGYAVARRLTDRPTALATAVLLAASPFLVSYGQEARMYALVGALTLGTLLTALAADERSRAGRPAVTLWLTCGALAAATVYTHYYGVLLVATLVVWGGADVVRGLRGAEARGWLIAGLTAAALFAPWLPRALRVADHPGWREELPLWRVPDTLAVAWSAQTGVTAGRAPGGWAIGATALAVALLAIGVAAWWARARRGDVGARRALGWLGAMTVVAAIVLLRKPDYHPRYFYPLLGAWFMAIAAGASEIARRVRGVGGGAFGWLPLAALVALWAPPMAGYYTDPAQRKTDYRRLVAAVLDAAPAASSRLFLDGPSLGIAERYVPAGADLKIENLLSEKNTALRRTDVSTFEARLDDLAHRRANLWLATDGAAEHVADAWLARIGFPVATVGIGDITLERWSVAAGRLSMSGMAGPDSRPGAIPLDIGDTSLPWRLGMPPPNGALRPDGLDGEPSAIVVFRSPSVSSNVVRAGGVLTMTLLWLPSQIEPAWSDAPPARRPHNVSVRLLAPDGTIVAHADRAPAAGAVPTTAWTPGDSIVDRHGLLVPAATPPGIYHLALILYDAETLAPAYTWSRVADIAVEPAP